MGAGWLVTGSDRTLTPSTRYGSYFSGEGPRSLCHSGTGLGSAGSGSTPSLSASAANVSLISIAVGSGSSFASGSRAALYCLGAAAASAIALAPAALEAGRTEISFTANMSTPEGVLPFTLAVRRTMPPLASAAASTAAGSRSGKVSDQVPSAAVVTVPSFGSTVPLPSVFRSAGSEASTSTVRPGAGLPSPRVNLPDTVVGPVGTGSCCSTGS